MPYYATWAYPKRTQVMILVLLHNRCAGNPCLTENIFEGTKNVELPWDFLHSIQKDITNLTRSLRRYLESYQRLCEAEAAHKSSIETEYERLDRIFRSFLVQSGKPSGSSINALLVQAWAQDQSNILKFHEEILDNVRSCQSTTVPEV